MRPLILLASLLFLAACAEPPAAPAPVTAARPHAPLAAFSSWAHQYRVASPAEKLLLEEEGLRLADARREALLSLAELSPERALQQRLPFFLYRDLPPHITARLEQPIDAIARYELLCADGVDGAHHEERFFVIDDQRFRAAVYGRRLGIGSKDRLRVHGLRVGDLLIASESPLRMLEPGEFDGRKPLVGAEGCASEEALLDTGDEVVRVCSEEEAVALAETLADGEQNLGPSSTGSTTGGETAASSWTEGHKDVLYIRVDFSDLVGEPISSSAALSRLNTDVNNYYVSASYGLSSVSATVTPVLRMPQTAQWYGSNNDSGQLLSDARAAASAAGYHYLDFDRDITAFKKINGFTWAGLGYIGNRGAWLNGNFTLRVTAHELGHNHGLRHANRLDTDDDSIVGTGTLVEYGHPWDIMGASNATGHFTAWFKNRLNWIPSTRVAHVTQSGTYRLHDVQQPLTSGLQGLKITRDSSRSYWLEYRPLANKFHATNGASIIFGFNSNQASQLLDMTPHTAGTTTSGREDSPLLIGRTYSDPMANVHITPKALAPTTPPSLDVVVEVSPPPGAAPTLTLYANATSVGTNAAVTFNANASDADGDPLSYFWDFDDGDTEGGSAQATHSWSSAGRYNVRCTVSDMKGNVTTASRLITVGSGGSWHVISGTIREGTKPLEGVRVTTGSRTSWTDSQGVYRLTRISSGNHVLTAVKPWFSFTPSGFTQPLSVSADATGADFTATREGFTVTGTVLSAGLPVEDITVTAGAFSARTDAQGTYRLVGLPSGTYTLEATGTPPRQFNPSGFSNPVTVSGDLSGRNFTEALYSISGQLQGSGSGVTVTDGVRTTTSYYSGFGYYYRLDNVPPGSWNLVATKAGSTATPLFTNPVSVTTGNRTGLNFNVTSGTTYLIRGRILESGVGVAGVVVDAGSSVAKTDSLGAYVFSGLSPGTYTLTPSLAPWRFSPSSRSVTISSANQNDIDFVAMPPNKPPTVVQSPTPSENPVYATSVTVSVLGDDDAGEPGLRYDWSLLSGPSPVSFSRNGTNGAKDTVVTFTETGVYTLQVLLTDADGATVSAGIRINVYPSLTQLEVSPAAISVHRDSQQAFNAAASDQFGAPYTRSTDWTWSVDGGGSIDANGLFTATTIGGPFTVTATLEDRSATAKVTVIPPGVPEILEPAASSQNPVRGPRATLVVLAGDDGGEENLTYTWRVEGGPDATFEPNASNAAKQTSVTFSGIGDASLIVRATDADGNYAESNLALKVEAGLATLTLTPSEAITDPGSPLRLKATALDQGGQPLSTQPSFAWSVEPMGATANHGLFVSKLPGSYTVTVTTGELSAQAVVVVRGGAEGDPDAGAEETGEGGGGGCGCSAGGLSPEVFLLLFGLAGACSRRRRRA